jgi:DNA excision repair protein ERCC-2
MSQGEKERFLDAFRDDEKLRIGFCVLGGSFSEGVDLPGRRLIGTVIVGTGMPGISNERNILKEYYDTTRERGFDYAYVYPGMNRVLQAAGRVIRREEDCGVVVLIDDRYGEALRASLLPDHWSHLQYAGNPSELAEIVTEFWHATEKDG